MSTTIDQRVVEMRFDNRHFEQNVSTTMSTLDKLKQKLRLDGANKGLENVNNATKNIKMDGLSSAVDTVTARFSALEVMGVTALANITNSAVNAGKRMVKALTLDPVTTGFKEYETQINATQTILSNTMHKGSDIHDVNKALEELNKYADKTIYNFTEMTRNIGTFTAAGIDLDTSVNAIQGIANLAAVSGSTSQQASTAMYQLSQALAAGTIRLMDWNSVVNAGMGGEIFQNALKETSEALGTGAEAAIKASGSFRESLRDGWLTSEVLTETLKKFTSSGANEYVAEYIGQSADVVKTALESAKAKYGEADAIKYASQALAEKYGKNADEIASMLEFAKNAEDAATKVKTFTQLWDVLKESAQSGWAQTWKIIVGDFEEAKSLLTPLSEFLTGMLTKMSDWRNAILESALGKSFTSLSEKMSKLIEPAAKAVDAVKETVDTVTDLGKVVDDVILGKFGNGQERFDALAKAGINYCEVQNKVNEKLGNGFRYTEEQIAAQNKLIGVQEKTNTTTEETVKSQTKLNESQSKQIAKLAAMSEAELKALGYTEEQVKAFKELESIAKKLGLPLDEFISKMDEIDGRWLLIESFKNAGKGLTAVFTAMKNAWHEIFPPKSIEERSEQLFNLIAALHKFSRSLLLNDETAAKFQRTFKGVFAVLDIIRFLISGPVSIAFKAFTQLLGMFDLNILDVTAAIGDAAVKLRDWIEGSIDFTKIFEKIVPPIKDAIQAFRKWIDTLKSSENLPKDIAEGIAVGFGKALEAIKNFFSKIPEYFTQGFDGLKDSPVDGIIEKLKIGFQVAGQVIVELGKILLEKVNKFLNAKGFEEISADAIAGLVNGLQNGASEVWNAALEIGRNVLEAVKEFLGIHSPSVKMEEAGNDTIDGFVLGIQNGSSKIWETIKGLFGNIVEWIKNLDFGTVLAGVIGIGTVKAAGAFADFAKPFAGVGEVLESTAGILDDLVKPIKNVVKGFAKIEKAAAFNLRMDGVKTLAISLLMVAGAVGLLSLIEPAKLWNAVGAVFALAAILAVLAIALNKLNESSVSFNLKDGLNVKSITSSLIGIGVAVLMIGATVKLISTIDPGQAEMAFAGLGKIIAAILAVSITFGIISKLGAGEHINSFGKMMKKMAVALLLMVAVIKLVSMLDPGELKSGTKFIANFAGFVLLLNLIALLPTKNVDKLGGMMIKMSIALMLMVAVVKLAAKLDESEIAAATDFLTMFVLFVGGLSLVSLIGGKAISGLGKMLMGVSVAMLILLGVVKLAGQLSPGEIIKGLFVIQQFANMIMTMVVVTSMFGSKAPKVAGTILAFGMAIGLLAAVAVVLGYIDIGALAKGIVAVGMLGALIAGVVVASRGAEDIKGTMIGIAVAIGVMAASIALLTLIDPTKLAITTGLMSVLMGMFALIVGLSKNVQKAVGTIAAIAGAIVAIGGILYLLSGLPVESVIGSAIALSGLMLVMTGLLAVLAIIGKMAKDAAMGALALASMAIPLAAFGLVLAMMSALKVTNALPNVLALTVLCTALTALLIPLSLIGVLVAASGGIILLGVVALLAMAVPLVAFVGIIALMSGIQNGIANANALTSLMTALGDVLVKISILAPLAIVGVAAMSAMISLMTSLGILVTAIGALVTKFPQLQEFLDTGIAMFERLASGLGSIIGNFIAGFAGAVMTILPQLGMCLSQFMVNATPFIVGAKMVDQTVLTGVGILAGAVLALTAADLVAGVASFLQGGSSFADLGAQLSQFMLNALPFITMASTLSPDMLTGVKALAETILILTAADVIQSLTSFITGGSSLESFATQLPLLGQGISNFSKSIGDFSGDQIETINSAASAIKTLAQASSEIPNAGGLLGTLVGENDLGVFASQFPILGSGLRGFVDSVGVFSDDQVTTVNCAAQAIKLLAQASSEIPNAGGLLGQLVGENDLGTFASQFPTLGSGLRGFLDNVGEFSDAQVTTIQCAADALKVLAQASSEIPNSGGLLAQLVGDNDLATFAEQFPSLGTGLKGFLDNVGTLDDTANGTITAGANAVSALATAAATIPNEGGWISKLVGDNSLGTFAENFPLLGSGLKGFIDNIGTFTSGQVTTVEAAVNAINSLAALANSDLANATIYMGTFGAALPTLGGYISTFCTNMPDSASMMEATTNVYRLLTAIEAINNANSGALSTFADNLDKVSKNAVDKFIDAFSNSSIQSDMENAAKDLADQAIEGVESKESDIESAGKAAAQKAVDGVRDKYSNMKSAGKYLVDGFAAGITEQTWYAVAKSKAMADAAEKAAKEALDINSPSKVFRAIGYSVPEGFAMGIDRMSYMVKDSTVGMADTAIGTISSSISRISDTINAGIDAQPTIRPVLDLSDVRSGASAIGSLFGTTNPIGVQANVSAISSMMNNRNQNGVNADVVSAIDKLNKKMDNLGNTTYSIQGVTYDDGSNIAEAVRTITRAAVRERRV